MKSVFSASEKAIYPAFMYEDYEIAGTWPKDGIEISDEDVVAFNANNQPSGKELGLVDGVLAWVDLPAPTQAELVSAADGKKSALLDEVNSKTQTWQTQLTLGMINDADKEVLISWMKYAQEISAVDTSLAPNIIWPEMK
ncbi:tail fiber assembly protein [Rahnella laticis]|uniref:tail fiber assembly protein n=1 Tax=Rahnella laticis TaxID=2787622 RepID=UPI0018A2D6C7|nr:tail fiber assembly protein [Rahnella laticis]MBF7994086.1 tail fiber assembly protein [Rahnella laticis]